MSQQPGSTIILDPAELGAYTDAELLSRFIAGRDERAFAALVRQHGPMVLGVCRRVLRDAHEAEDAFQATFLVLSRKAASIRNPALLANWLYGVAQRTALRARCAAARRQARERQALMPAPVSADPATDNIERLLDEELQRLPEKYRAPIVLCCLEGKTNEEAGRQLGCPRETVATRLSRARERLRVRLTRRGLVLSAPLLATVLAPTSAMAAVPAPLATSTIQTAVAFTAKAATAGVSGSVAALTEGMLRTMFLAKLKVVLAAALALTIAVASAGLYLTRADGHDKKTNVPEDRKPIQKTIGEPDSPYPHFNP